MSSIARREQTEDAAHVAKQDVERDAALSVRQRVAKRVLDLCLAVPLLVLCAPFFILLAICIRVDSRGPFLFRQKRVGLLGREFELLKFRTMQVGSDAVHRAYVREWMHAGEDARQRNGEFKLADDARITRVGRVLRQYSLDELPQLINVVLGDMSLVGPRPALPYEVEDYVTWQRERLRVPPGITGLWQVSGRNRLSFQEMMMMDITYVKTQSPLRDLSILLRTLPVVLRGTGN